jgi:ketosteroid isomerase-like protein
MSRSCLRFFARLKNGIQPAGLWVIGRKPSTNPDVEFLWPSALPYGGTFHGKEAVEWSATWNPLQPTAAERKMDPRVIGADDHQVVILYHQRGVSPSGERFDGEVIGLYELRDFRLSRAQMFYFDEAALV